MQSRWVDASHKQQTIWFPSTDMSNRYAGAQDEEFASSEESVVIVETGR